MEANNRKQNKAWSLMYQPTPEGDASIGQIAKELGVPARMAQVLYNRGCHTASAARAFLDHSEEKMHDPFLLKDVELAVSRIRLALERGERIAIYGDYDVEVSLPSVCFICFFPISARMLVTIFPAVFETGTVFLFRPLICWLTSVTCN